MKHPVLHLLPLFILVGALCRGAMLIANSDDPVSTRHAVAKAMRLLLSSLAP